MFTTGQLSVNSTPIAIFTPASPRATLLVQCGGLVFVGNSTVNSTTGFNPAQNFEVTLERNDTLYAATPAGQTDTLSFMAIEK